MAFKRRGGQAIQLIKEFLNVSVNGTPALAFDWEDWGDLKGVAFMVVNKTSGVVTATPEASPDATHVVTVGTGVPTAVAVPADGVSYDPYGVDFLLPFWRFWLSGAVAGNVDVYVFAVKRPG